MFAWHCDRLATLSRLVSVLNWKVPYQLSVVAVTPGVTVAIVKVSLWSRGKVGRTVRVLGRRRGERGRSPVHPDWGGGVAGTVTEISDSLPGSSHTAKARAPEDAMPGRGAERLPGEPVQVEPIDQRGRPRLDGGLIVDIGPETVVITVAATRQLHRHRHKRPRPSL